LFACHEQLDARNTLQDQRQSVRPASVDADVLESASKGFSAATAPHYRSIVTQSFLRLFRVAPLVATLLAGCAGAPDLPGDGLPSDIAGKATLTAVTTRKPAADPRSSPWFGTERSNASIVQVGLASPYRAGRFSLAAAGLSDWKVQSVEAVPTLTVGQASDAGGVRDVLLYVHGFNETFEGATLDAARLSDALGFRGDTVLFSWPSRASLLSYMADRESAIWSRDALEETLDTLLSNPGVGRVNIVAHSMGGMLTVEALRQVHARNNGYMGKFGAVVFASPDIDIDGFSASVRRMGDLHRRMTVVTATDDRALAISAGLAGGRRVGGVEKARLEELGIEVVDASGLSKGLLRHDLFLSDATVQKVISKAIRDARNEESTGSAFQLNQPPIRVEPLPAVQ
jgi:esterase/lipase superfamily enzyme